MYSEQSSIGIVSIIALCTQMQGSVTVLIASFAAPRPPTVTITPLYGCGYLLEINSQATMGVGCDSTCVFHTTSLCHMCFYFLLFLLLQKVCFC